MKILDARKSTFEKSLRGIPRSQVADPKVQSVVADILATASAAGPISAHERQPSKGGKYVSHRLEVRVENASEAHALRAALRGLDGVMTVL